MRTLELGALFVALFAVLWPVVFGVRPRRGVVPLLAVVVFVAHLVIEGGRWQMIPIYLVLAGVTVGDIFFVGRNLAWSRRVARGFFGVLGLSLAAFLPFALPVPELPVPSGPEQIGTTSFELVDDARAETYGERPGQRRRVMAQVWYPAENIEGAERLVWSSDWDVVAPAMASELGFPRWSLNHTQYTMSNSYEGAPVAEGRFPVVIYSHGWTGFRTIAVNQVEHLVSSGYIVIAVDHTYGSIAVRFSDQDIVLHDPAALPDAEEVEPEVYDEAATALVDTFAGDISLVLDELFEADAGVFSELASAVDLDRIGVYGHSTGGGAAVKTCLADTRCKAVLGMDAWVEPLAEDDLRQTMTVPSLHMRSDEWRSRSNEALLRGIAARGDDTTYFVDVIGAGHNDFVMTPLISPLASSLGMKGPIPAGRVIPIIDNYLLGFFDVFLLETGTAALDSVSFPEVEVAVVGP